MTDSAGGSQTPVRVWRRLRCVRLYTVQLFATAQAAKRDIRVCYVAVGLCRLVILFSILVFARPRPSQASPAKPSQS